MTRFIQMGVKGTDHSTGFSLEKVYDSAEVGLFAQNKRVADGRISIISRKQKKGNMISTQNVLHAVSKLTLNESSHQATLSVTAEEKNVASDLYDCLNFILQSSSHCFETEIMLDHEGEAVRYRNWRMNLRKIMIINRWLIIKHRTVSH